MGPAATKAILSYGYLLDSTCTRCSGLRCPRSIHALWRGLSCARSASWGSRWSCVLKRVKQRRAIWIAFSALRCSSAPGFEPGPQGEADTARPVEFSFREMTYGSEHRLAGNSDHAFEGQIHLQDQENGASDRER